LLCAERLHYQLVLRQDDMRIRQDKAKTINTAPVVDEVSRRLLFGQDASTVR
jgi:hypothetical protein